ncbi:MAG: hypothetical protein AAF564_02030 [Bacteroidota bacterium]
MKSRISDHFCAASIYFVLFSTLLLPTAQVSAQSTDAPASPVQLDIDNPRSPDWAVFHSATHTLLPLVIGYTAFSENSQENTRLAIYAYSLIIGPSTGYFYGRDTGRAFAGIMARTIGFGTIAVGSAVFIDNLYEGNRAKGLLAIGLWLGGGGLALYSIISDMNGLKRVVRERNAFYANRGNLSMTPIYAGKKGGYGVALRLTL